MPELLPIRIHQQDGRNGRGRLGVDGTAHLVQDVFDACAVTDHLQRPLLGGTQRLGSFSIFDVGRCPVPLDDPASFVAERFDPEEEPAVDAVGTPQPRLALAGLALGKERFPLPRQSAEVVRVDGGLPAPPETFLQGETRVVLPPPVQEFLRATRLGAPRKRRDCVDDLVTGIHDTAASVADLQRTGVDQPDRYRLARVQLYSSQILFTASVLAGKPGLQDRAGGSAMKTIPSW